LTRLRSVVANTALAVLVCTVSAPVSFATETVPAELLEVMEWRMVGPYRGGRVTTVTGVPGNPQLYYMGCDPRASGAGHTVPSIERAHSVTRGRPSIASGRGLNI
jgi:hypothetical protein